LNIGNGKIPVDSITNCISFPLNFCVIASFIEQLIQKVFSQTVANYKNHQWLCERAILAAKNTDVNAINYAIQEQIPSESVIYKFINRVMNLKEVVNYSIEFLNLLDFSGVSPHRLSPTILLRNINHLDCAMELDLLSRNYCQMLSKRKF